MILVTGNGKLAKELVKLSTVEVPIISLSKKDMDITNEYQVSDVIKQYMMLPNFPKYLIHTAALTKPMDINDRNPILSLDTNIIGTANVAKICNKYGIKFIYISTDFVYQVDTDKIINEESPVCPSNKYGWSKLGGECVAKLIENHLILRCALCDIPFRHKYAYSDVFRSPITHKEVANIVLKVKDECGTINVGNDITTLYDFVSKYQDIKKGYSKNNTSSIRLCINKLRRIINGKSE